MKRAVLVTRETISAFAEYIQRIRYAAIALSIYIFFTHFHMLSSPVPGIDTEHLISDSTGLYASWRSIGRQGLWFVKYISGNNIFNPYFAALLAMLMLMPVCLFVPFMCNLASGKKEGYRGEALLAFIFGAIVVSHPIMTEQLYFTLQSAEIVFSFFLLELCLIISHFWSATKNLLFLLPVIVLLQIPFSTYQAFVPLFITGAVGMTFVQSLFTSKTVGKQSGYVIRFIVAFLSGFLLNQIIFRLFATSSSYLSDQFYWGRIGFTGGCLEILSHVRDVYAGFGIFYFRGFFFLSLVLILLIIYHCTQIRKPGIIVWQIFLLAAWLVSPFYMSVLLGIRPVARVELVLPLTMGGTAFLCGYLFIMLKQEYSHKIFRNMAGFLVTLLCVGTVYQEAGITSRMYYTDAIRKQEDLSLAQDLRRDIQIFTGENNYSGIVIFWGRRETLQNTSCIQGDIMGQSFFNWDVDVEPFYLFSSIRIIDFLNTLGSSYRKPTVEQIGHTSEVIADMPCYPSAGSIAWLDDAVIIKLSEQ